MSMIACTQNCCYQRDGRCMLETAARHQDAVPNEYCVDFTPKTVVTAKPPTPPECS